MRWTILFLAIFFFGCTETGFNTNPGNRGYAPVYLAQDGVKKISIGSPRQTASPGKIYAFRNFIFQNDLNTGIHIIDNSNPSQPVKVGFINIPLSTEVAVKGDFLYSNNYDDLVVFDISKPSEPRLLNRVKNVFPPANQTYPPFNNIIFECADSKKGVVIRWELKELTNANCRR
ncbi:MAG: hypothetical protein ABI151_15075 [Chitinophagaceae bacterium]